MNGFCRQKCGIADTPYLLGPHGLGDELGSAALKAMPDGSRELAGHRWSCPLTLPFVAQRYWTEAGIVCDVALGWGPARWPARAELLRSKAQRKDRS